MKRNIRSRSLPFITWPVKSICILLILFITFSIVRLSLHYFTPSFERGFLAGKADLFEGIFPYGLYMHIIIAPLLIVMSTVLIFFRLELKFPKIHRLLGKTVVIAGFLLFVPSSFILAQYALGGIYGRMIFNLLSLLSLISLFYAYTSIRKKEIEKHKRWMLRFYIFLISALFLRINKFVFFYYFDYYGPDTYLWAAILSWLPQWMLLELIFLIRRTVLKK